MYWLNQRSASYNNCIGISQIQLSVCHSFVRITPPFFDCIFRSSCTHFFRVRTISQSFPIFFFASNRCITSIIRTIKLPSNGNNYSIFPSLVSLNVTHWYGSVFCSLAILSVVKIRTKIECKLCLIASTLDFVHFCFLYTWDSVEPMNNK